MKVSFIVNPRKEEIDLGYSEHCVRNYDTRKNKRAA